MRGAALSVLMVVGAAYVGCGSDPAAVAGADSGAAASSGTAGAAGSASGAGGQAGSGVGGEGGPGGTSSVGGSSGSGGAGGSGATTGGTGGSGVGGGTQDAGFPDVVFTYDGGSDDGSLSQDSACATGSAVAESVPLDMYIILDRSGSMNQPLGLPPPPPGDCNVGSSIGSRWCFAINALDGFFGASTSSGMGVALQFFPNGLCQPSCNPIFCVPTCCSSGSCCQGGPDSTPAVGYGLLPGHRPTLVSALNAQTPTAGTTPIEPALRGLAAWTAANVQPGRKMIGILITDGGPNGCQTNANNLANIAAQHLANNNIETFAIGMDGADFNVLETIGAAGGAMAHTNYCAGGISPCHFYNVGNGNPAAFIDALQAIQSSAIGCTYNMPTTSMGIIDPEQVTVEYSPGGSPPAQSVPRVTDQSMCTSAGGWYYDNNSNPTTISLCPDTCSVVSADPSAKIDILLGCLGS